MKTTLKVKSKYPVEDVEINKHITDFAVSFNNNRDHYVEFVTDQIFNVTYPVICFDYDDQEELKGVISLFNEHRYDPVGEYEDIRHEEYTLSLESEYIHSSNNYLNEKNLEYMEEQINIIDYICSDIVYEQEDIKSKVDALYGFFEKSGILYYKQTIETLLDVLEKNNDIGKNSIRETLFRKVH